MNTLGIDIGGSSIKGAMSISGQWKTAQSEPYANPERAELVGAVRMVVDQFGGGADCCGLCLPGKQSEDGQCIENSVNLPALNGWAFDELICQCGFKEQGSVFSDAVAAGADFVQANGLNQRSACISIGTGVGLGVFDQGQSVGIGNGGAGHLGHSEVERGRVLESVIGVPALRLRFGESIEAGIAGLAADDPVINAAVYMIRLVHAIYVPRHVVLLGGIGILLQQHSETITQLVNENLASVADSRWDLRFGSSMYHAAMGAARLAQDA
jgi:predicted NBD/HSP70 family sugar kinase